MDNKEEVASEAAGNNHILKPFLEAALVAVSRETDPKGVVSAVNAQLEAKPEVEEDLAATEAVQEDHLMMANKEVVRDFQEEVQEDHSEVVTEVDPEEVVPKEEEAREAVTQLTEKPSSTKNSTITGKKVDSRTLVRIKLID